MTGLLTEPFQAAFMQRALLAVLVLGVLAGAVGVFVVLRRLAFVGDALTHTVFPGVVVAFLIGQSIFLGALAAAVLIQTLAVSAIVLTTLMALRKELLLRAFNPGGAAAMGYRVDLLDLVLNVLIALVVVAAVKAVGTVLVIALIIVPAATARLLVDRVATMTAVSCGLGAVGGWLGLAISYDVSLERGVRLASGATIVVVLVAG